MRGLAKDPFQRYPSIGDFADKLARAAQLVISSEQLRLETMPKAMTNSAQRAPTLDASPRQRTTKPLRPTDEKAASTSDRATAYASVIPDPRLLTQNPRPAAAEKTKPVRARLRSPVHFEEASVEALRGGSQRIRKPADGRQRQPSIPDVVDAGHEAAVPEAKLPTNTELARHLADPAHEAALPEAKLPTNAESAQLMLLHVKQAVALGDKSRAVSGARAAIKLIQGENSQQVATLIASAGDVILPLLLEALGGSEAAISLRQRPSSNSSSISPTHMFLASRIVDKTTVEEIMDISHLSKAETLGILLDFRDEGLLASDVNTE